MKFLKILIFSILPFWGFSQFSILPSIGVGDLPMDSDSICKIPLANYLNFDTLGLIDGDTVFNFNLYSIEGNEINLEQLLEQGKPVLLISGSYTCIKFRNKVTVMNELLAEYGEDIYICIIYTVEAHPLGHISPYFGVENVTQANINENILYPQPTTYGERKDLAQIMLDSLNIDVPVFIDGPCNDWWLNYGQAANNAHLIDVDGTVFSKHGWFDRQGNDIYCDIINLLYDIDDCVEPEYTGNFEFSLTSDTIAMGIPEETIFIYGELVNDSNNPVEIEVVRLEENLPLNWSTSICLDICYPPEVDTVTFVLDSGEVQAYTMYFYTDEIPGQGMVKMNFYNLIDNENLFTQNMYAETQLTSTSNTNKNFALDLFPNPATDILQLSIDQKILDTASPTYAYFYTSEGKEVLSVQIQETNQAIDISQLNNGIYYCLIENDKYSFNKSLRVIK